MKQNRIKLYNALKDKPALGKVQQGWSSALASYPATIIYQASGTSRTTVDGAFTGGIDIWSIDCFAKTILECDNMEEVVDLAVKDLTGCLTTKLQATDLYEQDAKIYHKVLRYQIKS